MLPVSHRPRTISVGYWIAETCQNFVLRTSNFRLSKKEKRFSYSHLAELLKLAANALQQEYERKREEQGLFALLSLSPVRLGLDIPTPAFKLPPDWYAVMAVWSRTERVLNASNADRSTTSRRPIGSTYCTDQGAVPLLNYRPTQLKSRISQSNLQSRSVCSF